jgi:CubicO group peptidase (beta-lactamase class C family)
MDDNQTNEELMGKLAELPLMFKPGTTWEYSMSTDVLGRVVEVASGKSLAAFIAERITRPLGMVDTAFVATGRQGGADRRAAGRPPARYRRCATRQRKARGTRAAAGCARLHPLLLPDVA